MMISVKCACTSGRHGHAPGQCPNQGLAPDVLCPKCNVEAAAERSTVIHSTGGFFANTAATIASVAIQPFSTSYIEMPAPPAAITTQPPVIAMDSKPDQSTKRVRTTDAAPKVKPKTTLVPVDLRLKQWVLTILVVSVAALVADSIAAAYWTIPTPNQQRIFDGLEWIYKAGFGAVFGLISGQGTRKK